MAQKVIWSTAHTEPAELNQQPAELFTLFTVKIHRTAQLNAILVMVLL
jgi:hypothetical protein